MACATLPYHTAVIIPNNTVSFGFITLTINLMKQFGSQVELVNHNNSNLIEINLCSSGYQGISEYYIEADATSAIYPILLASLTNRPIELVNLNNQNGQSDNRLILKCLSKLKIPFVQDKSKTEILNPSEEIAIDIGMETTTLDLDSSDIFMTIVVYLACKYYGHQTINYTIYNIANQNAKECQRIINICLELRKIGLDIKPIDTGLIIKGYTDIDNDNDLNKITLNCYSDHRMAMSFALLATKLKNITITHWQCVTKTYPNFWEMFYSFGLEWNAVTPTPSLNYWDQINSTNCPILLIGFPSAGKTTLGKILSHALDMNFIDTDEQLIQKI